MSNYNNYPCKQKSNHGISLVECMIGSILGIFLLFGIIEVYVSIRTTYGLQQSLARIQENGRYAVYFLNQNIRMAGYKGCDEKLHGYTSKNLPQFLRNSRVITGTDVIVINRCEEKHEKQIAYFIADTQRKTPAGKSVDGLYEKIIVNRKVDPAQELVNNVSNMQINYGITFDQKNISIYEKLPENWQDVRSVEIILWLNADKLQKEWHTYITLRKD